MSVRAGSLRDPGRRIKARREVALDCLIVMQRRQRQKRTAACCFTVSAEAANWLSSM